VWQELEVGVEVAVAQVLYRRHPHRRMQAEGLKQPTQRTACFVRKWT